MTTETTIAPAETGLTLLDAALAASGLTAEQATTLSKAFSPIFQEATEILRESKGIAVTDATQLTEMAQARAKRLALVNVRGKAEKAHKDNKQRALQEGRAVDACRNELCKLVEAEESRLKDAETFAQRAEAARKETRRQERVAALHPFGVDPSVYNLLDMPDQDFAKVFSGAKLAHEEEQRKIAEAKKAEADQRAKEKAERERQELEAYRVRILAPLGGEIPDGLGDLPNEAWIEVYRAKEAAKTQRETKRRLDQERLRLLAAIGVGGPGSENLGDWEPERWDQYYAAECAAKTQRDADAKAELQRLARESAARAEELRIAREEQRKANEKFVAECKAVAEERVKADAMAAAERLKREAAEAEIQRQKDAQAAKEHAEAEAKREAEALPDRSKIGAFVIYLRNFSLPACETEAARAVIIAAHQILCNAADEIEELAQKI